MCELMLVRPSKLYAEQVMSYKEEMLQCGDSFDGCAGLEDVQSFDEWIDFERRLREKYKSGYVPSEVFLAVRRNDDFVVGMIDFRHPLSDFLKNFGGNIGYSVRPSERRKGYASEMLGLILPFCREFGESRVLLTCDKGNVASQRTIIKNGGVIENEIADTVGLSKSGIILRFWISIQRLSQPFSICRADLSASYWVKQSCQYQQFNSGKQGKCICTCGFHRKSACWGGHADRQKHVFKDSGQVWYTMHISRFDKNLLFLYFLVPKFTKPCCYKLCRFIRRI